VQPLCRAGDARGIGHLFGLALQLGRTPGELAKQRLCAVLGSYRTATKEGTGEGRRGEGKGGKGGKPKQQLCAVLGC